MAKTELPARDHDRTRTLLAFTVIGLGIVGIAVISVVALGNAEDEDETSRLIFAAVLPLLGTWVGAVLAFYFSRDNLQAASETTLRTVRAVGLTAETLVTEVMIRTHQIQPVTSVADEGAAQQIPLKELYDVMQATKRARNPILNQKRVVLYVVHEADIDKYAQDKGKSSTALAASDTVGELLKNPAAELVTAKFVTVPETATLGQARDALSSAVGAKDVFVTDDGRRTGTVLGWLTNSDLARAN